MPFGSTELAGKLRPGHAPANGPMVVIDLSCPDPDCRLGSRDGRLADRRCPLPGTRWRRAAAPGARTRRRRLYCRGGGVGEQLVDVVGVRSKRWSGMIFW